MKELSDKNKPQSLEELFRASLEEAEVTPSERVWDRIEQGLGSKEAGYYRERLGWYRTLAAACIFLVVCAASYLYYDKNITPASQNTIAQSTTTTQNQPVAGNAPAAIRPEVLTPSGNSVAAANQSAGDLPATALAQQPPKSVTNKALKENGLRKNKTREPYINNTAASEYIALNNPAKNNKVTARLTNLPEAGPVSTTAVSTEENADLLTGNLKSVVPTLNSGVNSVSLLAEVRPMPVATNANANLLAMLPESPAEQNEKNKTGRWSFSAKYAPHYFNQNIQLEPQGSGSYVNAPSPTLSFNAPNASNAATPSYSQALNEFDNNTNPGFSYNTGVVAGYALNKHWSLESGINYTQNIANSNTSYVFSNTNLAARYNYTGVNTDTKQSLDPIVVLPSTALIASLSGPENLNTATVVQTPTFETQYRYRLIGIPVRLNYQTSQRKSFYYASVGFLTNMLVQAQVLSGSAKVPDIKFQGQTESPFRTWQVAATVSAGRGFKISKSINLRAGLEGTQNLNSLAAQPENLSNGRGKPYTIGVAFSSSYTLGQ